MRKIALLVTLVVGVTGCQFPRDTEGTLERVRGGLMRVGVTEADPWVKLAGREPSGVEVELVRRFASELDAEIEWVRGSEAELVGALETGQLDLLVGGLDRRSPWQERVTLTRPYVNSSLVVAAPRAEQVPEDLDGVPVAVERDTEAAGLLEEKTDADPVKRDTIAGTDGPALVWDYMLDDLGLEATGRELKEEEHCMAVRNGENAWLVELEHFLLDRGAEAREILDREGRA